MSMSNHPFTRAVLYAWAAPTTVVGLVAGLLTLCTGGRVQAAAQARSSFMADSPDGLPTGSALAR